MKVNEIAAYIHKKMCKDNRFGYSQDERWGSYSETWIIDGKKYTIKIGDYDCSSSVITAWRLALQYTSYAHALDSATYTGNMKSVFVNSGLFDWKSMSYLADTGDLYLTEYEHTAMCQSQYPDKLSEFSLNEFGGTHGGKRGDQTGREAYIHNYYDLPWDGFLRYNGRADSAEVDNPEWQGDVVGKQDTTGSGDNYAGVYGKPILYLALENAGSYQVHNLNGKWLPTVNKYDLNDEEYGMAGSGVPIDAVRIFDSNIKYQTHNKNGGWNDVMEGTHDTGGSKDDYAGQYGREQDAIRIWRDNKGKQPRYNVFS